MKYLKFFENYTYELSEKIKNYLITEHDCGTWKHFIDNQECGDCQAICGMIKLKFPQVHHIFGEIKLDEDMYDENNDEMVDQMTHHWIKIDDEIYDFSKGTLKNYINYDDDLYSVTVYDDTRYKELFEKTK